MNALADSQARLVAALFAWPSNDATARLLPLLQGAPACGLRAYQGNGHAAAQRALSAAYPVTAQLMGDESFSDLSLALWHSHPPVCGDLGRWGDVLPAFLEASRQLQDEPYLADVARVEWALHRCLAARNVDLENGSLAMLTTEDPDLLTLVMAPGMATLDSRWPVASIMSAHRDGTPTMQEVGHLVRASIAQAVVVWRDRYVPRCREAIAGEPLFLERLAAGHSLAQALESAAALDFAVWLPLAVQTALVVSVSPLA
jgi:hypothetical protein